MAVWRKANALWTALSASVFVHGVVLFYANWHWTVNSVVAPLPVPGMVVYIKEATRADDASAASVYGRKFFPLFAQADALGVGAYLSAAGKTTLAGTVLEHSSSLGRHMPLRAATDEQFDARSQNAVPKSLESFLPAFKVDRVALPVSAPDFSSLSSQSFPAGKMLVRLFIDSKGWLVDLLPTGDTVIEDSSLAALRDVFSATRFIPALKGRQEVPSFLDVEIEVSQQEPKDETGASVPALLDP